MNLLQAVMQIPATIARGAQAIFTGEITPFSPKPGQTQIGIEQIFTAPLAGEITGLKYDGTTSTVALLGGERIVAGTLAGAALISGAATGAQAASLLMGTPLVGTLPSLYVPAAATTAAAAVSGTIAVPSLLSQAASTALGVAKVAVPAYVIGQAASTTLNAINKPAIMEAQTKQQYIDTIQNIIASPDFSTEEKEAASAALLDLSQEGTFFDPVGPVAQVSGLLQNITPIILVGGGLWFASKVM